jgi:hypothetical protein
MGVRNTDAPVAGYLSLDIPSSLALGIVEIDMQIQFARGYVTPLPNLPRE